MENLYKITSRSVLPRKFPVIALWLIAFAQHICQAQNPPKILAQDPDMKRVVASGSTLQLPCGVEGDPGSLFFEWFKQGQPLLTAAGSVSSLGTGDRFRVTQGGALKIKSAMPEDTGLYTCRAVNGFGTARVGITLIVLGGEDYDAAEKDQNNNLFIEKVDEASKSIPRTMPGFVQVSRFSQPIIQRPVGSSVRLKCEGKGHPKPQLTWLRNGRTMMADGFASAMGQLPAGAKKGRWTLHLHNLKVQDSGNYTCLLHNSLGAINTTFAIEVVDHVRQKPELTGDHPVNTTVEKGAIATLQCRVRSDITPHIQWLKRVDRNDPSDENLIKVQGEFFRVLKSSEVLENPEGTFLNKLVISDVGDKDSGKYVCLGANTLGFSFRSAYVTVLQPNGSKEDWSSVSLTLSTIPFPITVAVIVLVIVFLACLFILLRRFVQRRRRRRQQVQNQQHLHQCQHGRTYFGLEPTANEVLTVKRDSNKRQETIGAPASIKSSKSSGHSHSGASRSTSRLQNSVVCL